MLAAQDFRFLLHRRCLVLGGAVAHAHIIGGRVIAFGLLGRRAVNLDILVDLETDAVADLAIYIDSLLDIARPDLHRNDLWTSFSVRHFVALNKVAACDDGEMFEVGHDFPFECRHWNIGMKQRVPNVMTAYTLFGAEVSYYTGKARAYLRWRGVQFTEQLATQEVYRDIILPNVGWPVIPVVKTPDGQIIQDTGDIISHIEATEGREPSVWPETPLLRFVSELLHLYGDEWLVIPAMHYRWSYNEDWAYAEFGALSAPQLSPEEQYEVGKKNGARFKGALPVLGVNETTIPGIEKSYEAFLDEFSAHLDTHPFILGHRTTLADFALFGPLYAHLYRDPKSGELMKRVAPRVADWVERVEGGERGDETVPHEDTVHDTLIPILKRQMREQLPALLATTIQFREWAAKAEIGQRVPRGLGEIMIEIEGCRTKAAARSFPLWRLQGALDVYHSMDEETRARADNLLEAIGGADLSTLDYPRLKRENSQLVLA